jgi:hypothetical protein
LVPFSFKMKQRVLFETTPFPLFIKKKSYKRCRFDGTVCHRLPLDAQRQGKKVFLPLLCSISPSHLPKNPNTTHTPSWPTTMMKGAEKTSPASGCTETHPPTHPPHIVFSYKIKLKKKSVSMHFGF